MEYVFTDVCGCLPILPNSKWVRISFQKEALRSILHFQIYWNVACNVRLVQNITMEKMLWTKYFVKIFCHSENYYPFDVITANQFIENFTHLDFYNDQSRAILFTWALYWRGIFLAN